MAATGREQPDTAAYGIALLSRCTRHRLGGHPSPDAAHPGADVVRRQRLPTLVRDEPRVAVAAVIDTPEGSLTVANTHLSFVPWWGWRQLRALMTTLNRVHRPLVLMGDLNMSPRRAAAVTGMRSLIDAPTFPVDDPREQLDHVLADGTWRSVKGEDRQLPISDHRALIVDLE